TRRRAIRRAALRQWCTARSSPGSQRFLQHFEAQIVAQRRAVARIAIREWQFAAGAAIAATLVEGDQFFAQVDHRHADARGVEFVAHDAFGLGQHGFADTAALRVRAYCEHAEITLPVL